MEIGKQIKRRRTEMKLSQDELAEKVYVSRQTISNWENDKNYPDVKSLLLLSSLFDVTLDILVKGDLEEMKEKVRTEDANQFKRDSTIFSILLICIILLPVPLAHFFGFVGCGFWGVLAIVGIFYAIRVEKQKKRFDIQTYKEILAFSEGNHLVSIEKNQEYGKRPYQKFLLVLGVALITIIVAVFMILVLQSI